MLDITLPNGAVLTDVPEGTPKEQIKNAAIGLGLAKESDFVDFVAEEEEEEEVDFGVKADEGIAPQAVGAGSILGTVLSGLTAEQKPNQAQAFGQRMVQDFASVPLDTLRGTAELADAATNFVGLEDVISDESALTKFAKRQKDSLRETFEVDDAYKDTWATDFGGALGSMAAFMAGGAASPGLGYAVATTSGAGRGSERIDAARESGVDVSQGQEDLGVFLHSLVGASEMAPIQNIFKRIPGDIDAPLKRKIFNRLKEIGASGLFESVQEQTASILDDAIEANVYNPDLNVDDSLYGKMTNLDPEFFKDVFTSREATVSFAAGAITDFATGLLQGVGRGKRFDINDSAQKEHEQNLRKSKDKAIEDIAESVSVAKGDSLPKVDLDVDLNLNILNERINELEASDKVFKTEETNKELEFLKARRRDLLRVQAMDSTIEYIKRKKDVSPDQIDLFAEENQRKQELISKGASETEANEIILGPTVSARGRDPIQRSAVHVAKTIGPDFATIEGEFEVVEGSIETDQNGQPQRKYEVVVGEQRFGQPLNSYEDAAKFASVLSDQRKKTKINNTVSQQIVSNGQPLTTDDTKTMASYGVTVLDPEQTTFTSSAVNLAGDTTVDKGFDETASLLDQRKKNLPVSKYTVSQKINANREKKGLLPTNSFTVEEAREVLGKKFGNLGDPKINTTLETETYQVDKESDGKIVVVSSNGQRFRGKRLTAKEYQDQLEAGKRPDKNKKYPFKTQREARAFAEKLNKNRGTAAVPEEVLHEDLQSALESKNISSKADSPEVNALVSKIVGKKVSKTSDLTSGEKKLVLSKIRSLPKFSRPTDLINFSKDPAPETTQETQQEPLALPGPSTDIQQVREAVNEAMNEVGLSDVKANVDYALRNVRRDRNGNLVYGIRQREANEEGVETFGGEGSPLVVDGTTPDGDGFYSDATGQIFLALDRVSPDLPIEERIDQIVEILTHEQIHAMRALDLFTDAEWRLLTKTAKQRNKAPGQTYFEWAQQNYPEFREVDQVEESIAELVRDARAGKGAFSGKNKLSGKPKTLVQRIINFVKGMANVIDGVGFRTFEELVSSIESGEVGGRERGQMRSARELERLGVPADLLPPLPGDTVPDEPVPTIRTPQRPDIDLEQVDLTEELNPGDPNSEAEVVASINDRMSRQSKFKLNTRVPKKTKDAYKLFRVDNDQVIVDEDKMTVEVKDGASFYPLFVDSKEEVVTDEWVAAESGQPVRGKDGNIIGVVSSIGRTVEIDGTKYTVLAYRPGMHSGDRPSATHIGGKAATGDGEVNYRKANQVWAKVQVGADQFKKWSQMAKENGTKENGEFVAELAEIKEVPEFGYYRYKTNPNMEGNWLISGEIKILGKALTPKQLESIRKRMNTEDVPLLPEVIKKRNLGIKDLTGESIKELKRFYPKTLKKLLPKFTKYVDSLAPQDRKPKGAKKKEDRGVLPSSEHVNLYQQNIKDRFSRNNPTELNDKEYQVSLLSTLYNPNFTEQPYGSKTIPELLQELQQRYQNAFGEKMDDFSSEEQSEIIARMIAAESVMALRGRDNATEWYKESLDTMISAMSVFHPELTTDQTARSMFKLALAITSNGQPVETNLVFADEVYTAYKQSSDNVDQRKFPIVGFGKESQAMQKQFTLINGLISDLGAIDTIEMLMSEFPVRVINSMGLKSKIAGEAADALLPLSVIFGPKVGGAFFPNLMGNLSLTTMDRWFMRTWGRMTGTLISGNAELLNKNIQLFQNSLTPEMVEKFNIDREAIVESEDGIINEAKKVFNKVSSEDFKEKDLPIFKAARAINNFMGGSLSPSGARHRAFIRKTMEKAKNILADAGINTDEATIQALIWYPEQAFYRKSGARTAEPANRDYGAEAINMATAELVRRGASQNEAATAIQSLVRGRQRSPGRTEYESLQAKGKAVTERKKRRFAKPRIISQLRRQLYGGKNPQREPRSYVRRTGKKTTVLLKDGTQREINPLSFYKIDKVPTNRLKDANVSPINFYELSGQDANVFVDAINIAKEKDPNASSVYVYPESDYQKMKVFLSEDMSSGFAIKPDGDIVSVFKDIESTYSNATVSSLLLATELGGSKLDAFDTELPHLYSLNGFKAVSRLPFSPEEAPPDWDKTNYKIYKNGEPDVVFMVFDPKNYKPYSNSDGTLANSYDQAVDIQTENMQPAVQDRFSRDSDVRSNEKKLRTRTPAKIQEAVQKNIDEFENRKASNLIPRFAIDADPEAQYVARNPEEALEPSQTLLDRYARSNSPDLSKEGNEVVNRISREAEKGKTAGETFVEVTDTSKWMYYLTKAKQNIVFNYAELERLYNKGDLKFGDYESSAFVALIMADRNRAVSADAMRHGAVVYENGVVKTEPFVFKGKEVGGLIDVFIPLYQNEYGVSLERLAGAYFAGMRAERLRAEGKETPVKEGDLEKIEQEVNKFVNSETGQPIIKEVYETWQAYNEKTITFLEKAGVLDSEKAEDWRNYSDYVPFYREAEGEQMPAEYPSVFGGMSSAVKLEPIKGSERSLTVPLLDAVTRNLVMATELGMKNIAQQRVIRDMMEAGMARQIVKGENDPNNRPVSLRVKGKKVTFHIDDPLVYESLLPMSESYDNIIIKMLGIPAVVMRELITRRPTFIVKNLLRDTFSAFISAGSNYIPVLDTFKGMFGGMAELSKYGVVGGYDNLRDPDDMKRAMRKFFAEKGVKIPKYEAQLDIETGEQQATRLRGLRDKIPLANYLVRLWELSGDITTASDAATRMAVYKDTLARTGSEAAAVFGASEVLNFGRRGRSPSVRMMTSLTPFLNARYQGLDVLYRAQTGRNLAIVGKDGKPAEASTQIMTALARGSLFTFASLAMLALTGDDEQFKDTPDEVRDLNIVIPTPSGVPFLFPLPFEAGIFYYTIPQRIADMYSDREGRTTPTELKETVERFVFGTAEGLAFNPLAIQAISPFYEYAMNFDTFSRRQIVPSYIETSVFPRYQQTPYTSELAKGIANVIPGSSPIKIDHLMKSYLPGIGQYLLGITDAAIRSELVQGDKTKVIPGQGLDFSNQDWWDYPFVNAFFRDKYDTGALQDFYDMKKILNQATTSLKTETASDEEKRGLHIAYANLLVDERESIKNIGEKLSDLRKRKKVIMQADYPAEVKKQQIDELDKMIDSYDASIYAIKTAAQIPIFVDRDVSESEYRKFLQDRYSDNVFPTDVLKYLEQIE